MKIKIIDYGYTKAPFRAHENDAGADVHITERVNIDPGCTRKISLKFGLELPDGYVGFICPRSSLSSEGIVCELAPIDSGYRGEIHAIVTNHSKNTFRAEPGDRLGQLVILPCIICDFTNENRDERGVNAFGSTGR